MDTYNIEESSYTPEVFYIIRTKSDREGKSEHRISGPLTQYDLSLLLEDILRIFVK